MVRLVNWGVFSLNGEGTGSALCDVHVTKVGCVKCVFVDVECGGLSFTVELGEHANTLEEHLSKHDLWGVF